MSIQNKLGLLPIAGTVAVVAVVLVGGTQSAQRVAGDVCPADGPCFTWDPSLAFAHVAADAVIAASYVIIAGTLFVVFAKTRPVLASSKILVMFGVLLLAAGLAHAVAITLQWEPAHWLNTSRSFVIAIVAIVAAASFPAMVPAIERRVREIAAQRRGEAWFSTAAANSTDAFVVLAAIRGDKGDIEDFSIQFANASAKNIFGELAKPSVRVLKMPSLSAALPRLSDLANIVEGGPPLRVAFEMRTGFGDPRIIEEYIVKLDDGVLIVAHDATARKHLDAQAIKSGLRDPLTGLHNRVQLFERIEAAMAMAHRTGRMVGLIFVDIDNFKQINDSEGHDLGDAILIAVANRLASAVRQTDIVFRYGGDEMVILAPGIVYSGDLAVLADRLRHAFEAPIEMSDGRAFPVTLSMGGAVSPEDAKDPAGLLRCADQAMYHSKGTGRNGFTLFEALRAAAANEEAPAALKKHGRG